MEKITKTKKQKALPRAYSANPPPPPASAPGCISTSISPFSPVTRPSGAPSSGGSGALRSLRGGVGDVYLLATRRASLRRVHIGLGEVRPRAVPAPATTCAHA